MRVEEGEVVVREEELLDWGVRSLMAAGAEEIPARTHAAILLSADRRGHYSHGFNRLDIYCGDIARYSSSQAEAAGTELPCLAGSAAPTPRPWW